MFDVDHQHVAVGRGHRRKARCDADISAPQECAADCVDGVQRSLDPQKNDSRFADTGALMRRGRKDNGLYAWIGSFLRRRVAPLFADLVYGLSQRDTSSLALAVVIAAVTGLVGTWVPVSRAAKANVIKVLRE